jgi:hypothetical protein
MQAFDEVPFLGDRVAGELDAVADLGVADANRRIGIGENRDLFGARLMVRIGADL